MDTEKDNVTNITNINNRLNQVSDITLNLPLEDKSVRILYHSLLINLSSEYTEENDIVNNNIYFFDIPINDLFNVVIECIKYCGEQKIDLNILTSIFSVFDTFQNLKKISLRFKSDSFLLSCFNNILDSSFKGNKSEMFNKIYEINEIEINLSSCFSKEIVDTFNEIFIFYGYLSNDFLSRRYIIYFTFEEFNSFIEMVFKNNPKLIEDFGLDNVNKLILFPTCIKKDTNIRIVTNYSTL